MPTSTKIEYLTMKDACAQLELQERRVRDYVNMGKIHKAPDGTLHAGDVARLQAERQDRQQGKAASAQLRALATASGLTPAQREQLERASAAARSGSKEIEPAGRMEVPAPVAAEPQGSMTATPQTPTAPALALPATLRIELVSSSPWLTIPQAAEYLQVSSDCIVELVNRGQLCPMDFRKRIHGGRYRIHRADLDELRGSR